MDLPAKDLIGRVMLAGALTVFLCALAVPLVWKGLAFALWSGLVAAPFAALILVVAAFPATYCFYLIFIVLHRAGTHEFAAKVLAFVAVTVLALSIVSLLPFGPIGDVPLRVWITPVIVAIPTALWTFYDRKQGVAGRRP